MICKPKISFNVRKTRGKELQTSANGVPGGLTLAVIAPLLTTAINFTVQYLKKKTAFWALSQFPPTDGIVCQPN